MLMHSWVFRKSMYSAYISTHVVCGDSTCPQILPVQDYLTHMLLCTYMQRHTSTYIHTQIHILVYAYMYMHLLYLRCTLLLHLPALAVVARTTSNTCSHGNHKFIYFSHFLAARLPTNSLCFMAKFVCLLECFLLTIFVLWFNCACRAVAYAFFCFMDGVFEIYRCLNNGFIALFEEDFDWFCS